MSRIPSRIALTAASMITLAALSGPAIAAADLVPDASNLAALGQAALINMGDQAAEPSQLIITCQKTSGPGGCAESPAMAAHEDAAYPDAVVINVPELAPGENYVYPLPFWPALFWPAGTYELTLTADGGDVVVEDDETNNAATTEKQQLAATGLAPIRMGPGALTITPQSGGGLPFQLQFTIGQ